MTITSGDQALANAYDALVNAIKVKIVGGNIVIDNAEINVDAMTAAEAKVFLGDTTDAATEGDVNGTLISKLRGLSKNQGTSADAATEGDTAGTMIAKLRGLAKNLGKTSDAAVVTDVAGSHSSFLRGLVKIFADLWNTNIHGLRTAPQQGAFTDRSGTVTAGGTRQQVMAANGDRRYLLFQNVSTGDLWIRFGANANADQPSILVPPRMAYILESSYVNTDLLDVIGATTGQAYSAKEA